MKLLGNFSHCHWNVHKLEFAALDLAEAWITKASKTEEGKRFENVCTWIQFGLKEYKWQTNNLAKSWNKSTLFCEKKNLSHGAVSKVVLSHQDHLIQQKKRIQEVEFIEKWSKSQKAHSLMFWVPLICLTLIILWMIGKFKSCKV